MSSIMSNPTAKVSKVENYEHVLMCLICRSLFDDYDHQPKFLPCHHTFCKECLREFVRQMGDEIDCPSCRKSATIPAAGVSALQTNFYAKYIQSLVYGLGGASGQFGASQNEMKCGRHEFQEASHFCKECSINVCNGCASGDCADHTKQPIVAVAEEFQDKIEVTFAKANELIERKKVDLESKMKAFSEDKDRALLRIDAAFESHFHLLNRRATLLKNKVIDSYNEKVQSYENHFEELSTAMTCIVSLKEFHETAISRGQLADALKGVDELEEVYKNINEGVKSRGSHINFDEKHGVERFKVAVKDLGRVNCVVAKEASEETKGGGGRGGEEEDEDNTQEASPPSPFLPSIPSFDDAINNNNNNKMNNTTNNFGSDVRIGGRGVVTSESNKTFTQKSDGIVKNNRTAQIMSNHNESNGPRIQRPISARFKKMATKNCETCGTMKGGGCVCGARNLLAKTMSSPVRRPKNFLVDLNEPL